MLLSPPPLWVAWDVCSPYLCRVDLAFGGRMVLFNYTTKEMTAKVVYYGPGLCGKTTNLQYIYENLPPQVRKGKMLSLATKTDRTLFFDFLPLDLGEIRGMKTRVQLYTVPGQVFYNSTRKLVLRGADGVVFVADSQQKMIDANIESYQNLEENLREIALDLADLPLVMQFNKRDLPNLASIEEMNTLINRHNAPFYEAVATTGIGVEDTLKAVTKLVLNHLANKYQLEKAGLKKGFTEEEPTATVALETSPVEMLTDAPAAPPSDGVFMGSGADPVIEEGSMAAPRAPEAMTASSSKSEAEVELEEELAPSGDLALEQEGALDAGVSGSPSSPDPADEEWLPEIEPESTFLEGDSASEGFANLAPEPLPDPTVELSDLLESIPEDSEDSTLDIFDAKAPAEQTTLPPEPPPAGEDGEAISVRSSSPSVGPESDPIRPWDPLGIGSSSETEGPPTQAVQVGAVSPGTEHQITVPLEMSVGGRPMRLHLRMTLTVSEAHSSER